MADEFQHKDPGSELTQAEFITTDGTGHIFQSQATGDILYASSATVLKALPIADNGDVLSLAAGIPAWTASAAVATKVTVTDNEDTAENNLVTFVAGAATATGAQSLEMDGHLTYNPNTGTLTATVFVGALTGTASNVTTNANLTGHVTSSGNAAVLGSFTSAQLATALTNETGTGLAVFNGSPVLTTPTIGSFANAGHDHADAAGGSDLLATAAETTTGTSTAKAVTPDGLAGSVVFGTRYVQCVVFDSGTDIAEGDGKFFFHIPAGLNGMNLVETHARVATAGNGSAIQVQLFLNTSTTNAATGNDMLTNLLTIDDGELDSSDSGVTEDIDETYDDVDTNDMIRIDVDGNGGDTTIAKGLIVTLGFRLP
jgi:hypothetical protein